MTSFVIYRQFGGAVILVALVLTVLPRPLAKSPLSLSDILILVGQVLASSCACARAEPRAMPQPQGTTCPRTPADPQRWLHAAAC